MTRLAERLQWPMWITLLVAAGIVLRVREYLANRSLWADESFLALELIDKGPAELTQELGFNQGAPLGFLLAEKAIGALAGYSEFALRFLPQLFGVLAVVAFVPLARRTIAAAALPLAIALVVVADGLIYYASELKQYSVDVFVAVYMLLVASSLARTGPVDRRTLLLGLGAVPVLWLSHPALFVACAGGLVIVAVALVARPRDWPLRIAVVMSWAITTLLVLVAAPDYQELREAQAQAEDAFIGQAEALEDPGWVTSVGRPIAAGLGFPTAGPAALLSTVVGALGFVGLLSILRRERAAGALLGATIVVTLIVSALELYPLYTRTLLFLVPVAALLIGQGAVELGSLLGPPRAGVLVAAISVAIAAVPAGKAVAHFVDRPALQELRPALAYVRDQWRRGDVLYVPWGDQHAYLYYVRCRCFDLEGSLGAGLPTDVVVLEGRRSENYAAFRSSTPSLVVGEYHPFDANSRLADLDRLRGRGRVWVVSAHLFWGDASYRDALIAGRLDRLGRRLDGFVTPGSRAYLYELRP